MSQISARIQRSTIFLSAAILSLLTACAPTDESTQASAVRASIQQMLDDFTNLRAIGPFPHQMTLEQAYRWQDELVSMLATTHGDVVGYKTGGHNPGPANPEFPTGGIRGQLLEGMFLDNGASVRVEDSSAGFLEADFALRVGDASINHAQTDLEILAGLDAIVPFAEIPDPLYEPDENAVNRGVVSNMASRFAFMGEPVAIEGTQEWLRILNNLDFAVLDEDDNVIQSGSMADWYQPIDAVRWLRDHLHESDKELLPGHILSLGNIGIIRPLHEGTPRGAAYEPNQFRVEYYVPGLEQPASVTINVAR